MDKLFRQVSVKDRLPEIEKYYHTNQGTEYFDADKNRFRVPFDTTYAITYWLEEINPPSEEDISNSIINSGRHISTYSLYQNGYEDGANYILNTLKGEKSNG